MKFEIGKTYVISDGNGGDLNARIKDFEKSSVLFVTRRGSRGGFGKTVNKLSKAKFGKLAAEAAEMA